jgi:hypothetical protein
MAEIEQYLHCVRRARRKLHDEWPSGGTSDTGLRWSNATVVEAVQDGLRSLWGARPDAFGRWSRRSEMPTLRTADEQAALLPEPLPVLDRWSEPLASYAASRLLADDVDHGDLGSAEKFAEAWASAVRNV